MPLTVSCLRPLLRGRWHVMVLGGTVLLAQTKNKLIAAVLGILIAAVPVYWFTNWLQRQGEAEASVAAKSSIALLNLTVRDTVQKLDDLASRGIDSCSPANVETLRQVLMATGAPKELA